MLFYSIYKTTNLLNNHIYIGKHETADVNDSYLGSGTNIRKAIKKYGKHNFKKEILFVFDNREEMIAKEKELVNEEFIKRSDTYNINFGGEGLAAGEFNLFYGKKHTEETKKRISESVKKSSNDPIIKAKKTNFGSKNGMFGKTHSPETIAKIRAKQIAAYDRIYSPEANRKRSQTQIGKKHTAESKALMSQRMRESHARRKMVSDTTT